MSSYCWPLVVLLACTSLIEAGASVYYENQGRAQFLEQLPQFFKVDDSHSVVFSVEQGENVTCRIKIAYRRVDIAPSTVGVDINTAAENKGDIQLAFTGDLVLFGHPGLDSLVYRLLPASFFATKVQITRQLQPFAPVDNNAETTTTTEEITIDTSFLLPSASYPCCFVVGSGAAKSQVCSLIHVEPPKFVHSRLRSYLIMLQALLLLTSFCFAALSVLFCHEIAAWVMKCARGREFGTGVMVRESPQAPFIISEHVDETGHGGSDNAGTFGGAVYELVAKSGAGCTKSSVLFFEKYDEPSTADDLPPSYEQVERVVKF